MLASFGGWISTARMARMSPISDAVTVFRSCSVLRSMRLGLSIDEDRGMRAGRCDCRCGCRSPALGED
jgi:hypothetical protein